MKMYGLGAFLIAVLLSLSACAAEMPWEDQLREMDYHIFHISG